MFSAFSERIRSHLLGMRSSIVARGGKECKKGPRPLPNAHHFLAVLSLRNLKVLVRTKLNHDILSLFRFIATLAILSFYQAPTGRFCYRSTNGDPALISSWMLSGAEHYLTAIKIARFANSRACEEVVCIENRGKTSIEHSLGDN